MKKYTYVTPSAALIKSNAAGIINRAEFNAAPLSSAALGWTADSQPVYIDIAAAPHVLIAGTTGSGKSVTMHNLIVSLLLRNTPADAEIYLIDPKMCELAIYEGGALVRGVAYEPAEALTMLNRIRKEMMKRYKRMRAAGSRNIEALGERRIYVFIDELADLMYTSKRQTEQVISSLARLGRAAGVHLIIATQRPTRDVLTGQIKLNIPTRIALAVPSAVDSVTVLGHKGAENLRGRGDAILMQPGADEIRIQGAYISDAEIAAIAAGSRQGPQKRRRR